MAATEVEVRFTPRMLSEFFHLVAEDGDKPLSITEITEMLEEVRDTDPSENYFAYGTVLPQVSSAPLEGTDDRLVRVEHRDGQYIVFRFPKELPRACGWTFDVSSGYADWGHDSQTDQRIAESYLGR